MYSGSRLTDQSRRKKLFIVGNGSAPLDTGAGSLISLLPVLCELLATLGEEMDLALVLGV